MSFKWIAGGLGMLMGGPLGAIIGYTIGSAIEHHFDANNGDGENYRERISQNFYGDEIRGNDPRAAFWGAITALFAAVINADGQVKKSEVAAAKAIFIDTFHNDRDAQELLSLLQLLLNRPTLPLREIAEQIRVCTNRAERREVLYLLLRLADADGEISAEEIRVISRIADYLDCAAELASMSAMFAPRRSKNWAYEILEISETASDDEIKRAYRRMAQKHHPDKVARDGKEAQQVATEKFKKIRDAYDYLQKDRHAG